MANRSGRPDGIIVQRCQGIIDAAEWEAVKAVIMRPGGRNARANANPLLGIVFCDLCGRPATRTSGMHKGKRYSYYKCRENMRESSPCAAKAISAQAVEDALTNGLMSRLGDVERVKRIYVAADDHAEDLRLTEEAITNLRSDRYERGLFRGARGASEYAELMRKLEEKRDGLACLPSRPAGYTTERTGQTYREHWEGLDAEGRRQFLLGAGIKVKVRRLDDDDNPRRLRKGIYLSFFGPAIDDLRKLAAVA
jgi:hypothetical protein